MNNADIPTWDRADLGSGQPTYRSGFCNPANPGRSHRACRGSWDDRPCICICHDPEVDTVNNPAIDEGDRKQVAAAREQRESLLAAAQAAQDAAHGDSNDEEIEALRDALGQALALLGLDLPEGRDPDEERPEGFEDCGCDPAVGHTRPCLLAEPSGD